MSLAAELAPVTTFITEEDLMRRPPEQGVAIDPPNPSEIDDAIWAEPLRTRRGFSRIQVHIADAGLLYGHDKAIAQARQNGWSEYFEDDTPPNLMLDEAIAVAGLSLNIGHHGTGYAPAVTVAFTFDSNDRRILDPSIYKSRVAAQSLTYSQFERRVRNGRGGKPTREEHEDRFIYLRARELLKPPGKVASFRAGKIGSYTVRNNMIVANSIIAKDRIEGDRPWLFRNHHMRDFQHPQADLIAHLYPDTAQLIRQQMAWYSRIPTTHDNLGGRYCHFTSPLRRFPDLANHLNLHADLEGLPQVYDEEEIDEIAREMGHKIVAALDQRSAK
jgi:exoribonuclease R